MSKSMDSSKLGATPGKKVLIAVLAVVFVVVIAVQFGGSFGAKQTPEGEPDREGRRPGPNGEVAAHPAQPSQTRGKGHDTVRPWPLFELADVADYDPFAAPKPVADRPPDPPEKTVDDAAEQAERDRLLEQLREEGVQAVVGSAVGGNAAVIGSQTVRVGDVLGRFRVVAIESDGVVLEPLATESAR